MYKYRHHGHMRSVFFSIDNVFLRLNNQAPRIRYIIKTRIITDFLFVFHGPCIAVFHTLNDFRKLLYMYLLLIYFGICLTEVLTCRKQVK